MQPSLRVSLFLIVVALVGVAPVRAQMPEDAAQVAETVGAFHAALAEGDATTVVAMLSPGVRILESGGLETLDEYVDHHLSADIAFAQAVPRDRGPLEVIVRGDVAWVVSSSRSVGRWRDRDIDATNAELMVLERHSSGWLISAIHWSSR
ncbi:YybH family protein [Gaopeijia maritima]|uniref:YybH family protein n=1 Tax=Gaopeijia maritima TaxID=3119007 RepID=UPI003273218B